MRAVGRTHERYPIGQHRKRPGEQRPSAGLRRKFDVSILNEIEMGGQDSIPSCSATPTRLVNANGMTGTILFEEISQHSVGGKTPN